MPADDDCSPSEGEAEPASTFLSPVARDYPSRALSDVFQAAALRLSWSAGLMIKDHPVSAHGFRIRFFTTLSSGCHFGKPRKATFHDEALDFGSCDAQIRRPGETIRESLKKPSLFPHPGSNLIIVQFGNSNRNSHYSCLMTQS
jgi:hypothetical protein